MSPEPRRIDFFSLGPRIHYGPGAARLAGEVVGELGARRVLVVTDPGVLAAGVCDPVLTALGEADIGCALFSELGTNPSEQHVHAAADFYREAGCDGVVGVGGGSALDVAKCAAAVLSNGGRITEYENGARPATAPPPPLVLAPTTAGTGSEAVNGAIITDSARVFKMHIDAVPAHAALCDPELTRSLPPMPTAASGIDALAHAIGAYVSCERQPLADAMALHAISLIHRWLPVAVDDGDDLAARDAMMIGSLSAGISMKGGGAVDHAFAHAVNALYELHHGVGVAMFLAEGMRFNLPHLPERFADIARALGVAGAYPDPAEHGEVGIAAVRRLVARFTPSFPRVDVAAEDLPALVDKTMADGFHLGLNPVALTRADAERVLRRVVGHRAPEGELV